MYKNKQVILISALHVHNGAQNCAVNGAVTSPYKVFKDHSSMALNITLHEAHEIK